jgi:hypothetical protein
MDEALRSDLIVNWVAAAGTLVYLVFLFQTRVRSTIESRALLLLTTLFALLVLRGFSWWFPGHPWLERLELLPATLLPLVFTLFTEGLLRRHAPLPLKLIVLAATGGFLVANLAGWLAHGRILSRAFPAVLAGVIVALAVLIAGRDRASLSIAENRLCGAILVIGTLGAPLALSDFRLVFGFPPTRSGALAVLALCHLLVRSGWVLNDARAALRYLGVVLIKAAIGTLILCAFVGRPTAARLAILLPVALALVLASNLWEHLRSLRARAGQRSFLRWLASDESADLAAFVAALRHCPRLDDHRIVGEDDLAAYDRNAILARLRRTGRDCTLGRLRRETRGDGRRTLEAAEQLVDLLERTQMTQVVLLSESPLRLLLVNRPEIADQDARLELRLIARRARNLARADVVRA